MSDFPKYCTFVCPLYGRLNHPWFFDHHPWMTSLSSIHGQRPRTALLSSKGDLVSYKPYSRSRKFLNLLGWFLIPSVLLDMDDHYGRIGDELISRYPINHIKESQTFWKARAWGVLLPTPYGRCLTKLRQKLIFGHSPKTLTVGVVRMRYP